MSMTRNELRAAAEAWHQQTDITTAVLQALDDLEQTEARLAEKVAMEKELLARLAQERRTVNRAAHLIVETERRGGAAAVRGAAQAASQRAITDLKWRGIDALLLEIAQEIEEGRG